MDSGHGDGFCIGNILSIDNGKKRKKGMLKVIHYVYHP